jgi:glycosyltransferase 2 family protein
VPAPDSEPAAARQSLTDRLGVSTERVSTLEPRHPGLRMALRVVFVVLVVGSVAFAITKEAGRVGDFQWRFQPSWLVLCVLALIAFEFCHIELWRFSIRSLGGRIDARRGRAIWSTTLLARYVPTSALMAVGRVALAEREGVAKRVTLASVAYELAFTVIASLILCVYLLWQVPALDEHDWVRWVAAAVPVVGLIVVHPAIFHRFTDYALRRAGKAPLPLSLGYVRVLELTVLYVISFVIAGIAVLAMTQALRDLPSDATYAAIASYALGYVVGVIGFVIPGSLGAREAGLAIGLSAVVPAAVAVAVAIAVRLLQIGVEVLYAVVMPLLARRGSGAAAG